MGIETLRGRGKVGITTVVYELKIHHNLTEAKPASIEALPDITGWVRPICGTGGTPLVLEIADGRKAHFLFVNEIGSVRVNAIKE
jgi:hypothetical protein